MLPTLFARPAIVTREVLMDAANKSAPGQSCFASGFFLLSLRKMKERGIDASAIPPLT